MELFFKATAGLLIAAVLALVLNRQEKDLGLMVSIASCIMGLTVLVAFLEPVLELLRQLQNAGDLNGSMLTVLLKSVGIGLIAEIAGMLCTDSGNTSLGKTLQMLGSAVILWLSIPVFQMLLDLMERILGEL